MLIHTLRRDFQPGRARSNVRSTVVLLTVAAMSYIAGALVHGVLPPPNDPVAFAGSARASETISGDAAGTTALLPPVPRADDSRWSSDDWTPSPRECLVDIGIADACVFMD